MEREASAIAGNNASCDFDRLLPCKRPGIALSPTSCSRAPGVRTSDHQDKMKLAFVVVERNTIRHSEMDGPNRYDINLRY